MQAGAGSKQATVCAKKLKVAINGFGRIGRQFLRCVEVRRGGPSDSSIRPISTRRTCTHRRGGGHGSMSERLGWLLFCSRISKMRSEMFQISALDGSP